MNNNHDLIIIPEASPAPYYGDDLAQAGEAAKAAMQQNVFASYHDGQRPNTLERQKDDLASFSTYLRCAGVDRSALALYDDPEAWRGINYALLHGFVAWLLQAGYAIGSINVRLATIRQYCRLAGPKPTGAGILDDETLRAILTVKGITEKEKRNRDQHRPVTRRGHKKARPVELTTEQALSLKKASITPEQAYTRNQDKLLTLRDALLIGLGLEHAFRCGEIAGLNIENFDLLAGQVSFYREKTDNIEKHRLHRFTQLAAERYLTALRNEGRTRGPLFTGYQGRRLSKRAINARVALLGEQIGIKGLSPHDLRHRWTFDALMNGTPIDQVISGGGWTNPAMALRYAKRTGIANAGVKITEEE